jgi:chemotaxis protein methyltransferase CheR/type IV pilus assembly protein PilK
MAWTYTTQPELTEEEFAEWQNLLEERTGISFEKHKQILQTGLIQRMQEVDVKSYRDYYHMVTFKKGWALEWSALLRTLTVKETRFLRDPDALEFLKKYVFKLLSSDKHRGSLNIWSVASSTGEEPYTLAMIANDCIEGLKADKYFGVTATDICLSSLSIARKGVYNSRRLEYMDKKLRERYFEDIGDNKSAVVKWLKDRVCFAQANIIDLAELPVNNMDIVYCQNVLIYFKKWRQQAVLDELVERLKPEGLLVVGMGEAVGWNNPKVTKVKDETVQAYVRVA